MNVIDKILLEWSYRCHDGIVDMNDPKKLAILQEMVNEIELEEAMLSLNSIQKRPDQFTTIFYNEDPFKIGKAGNDDFIADYIVVGDETFYAKDKNEKSNLVGALRNVQNSRNVRIVGQLNGQETTLSISSIYKSANLGGQTGGGAGVSNEKELVDAINSAITQNNGDAIDVKFVDENDKETLISDVTQAKGMGTTGSKQGLKGDVTLVTKNGEQNLSVKKDGPYWWSSERKNFAELLNKFIESGKAGKIPNLILQPNPIQPKILDMMDPSDKRRYGRIYILNYPGIDTNLEKITFGLDQAKIVQRSFSSTDYSLENGVLTVKTTRNMNDVSDLKDDDKPVIMLARHENQSHGIDFRTIPYKQANFKPTRDGKVLVLDYKNTPSIQITQPKPNATV
jgi:hypothetical protein